MKKKELGMEIGFGLGLGTMLGSLFNYIELGIVLGGVACVVYVILKIKKENKNK